MVIGPAIANGAGRRMKIQFAASSAMDEISLFPCMFLPPQLLPERACKDRSIWRVLFQVLFLEGFASWMQTGIRPPILQPKKQAAN
jgi:hypothetical protein